MFEPLDVTNEANVAQLARRIGDTHGGIDIILSNAAARIVREVPAARQVTDFVDTNNHGTYRMLKHFMPVLRQNARFVVVASSFGTLRQLPVALHARFDVASANLEDIEIAMDHYVAVVRTGTAAAEGWPDWINVPSKVGQAASAKVAARIIRAERPNDGILINAVCPGLMDTEASRPWFSDLSQAQSPDDAAEDVLWLALLPPGSEGPAGQLVQFRRVLPWA